jgi:hypothetical protein
VPPGSAARAARVHACTRAALDMGDDGTMLQRVAQHLCGEQGSSASTPGPRCAAAAAETSTPAPGLAGLCGSTNPNGSLTTVS